LLAETATAAVAMMTLMTVSNLGSFAHSLKYLLRPNSPFVAVFTHPCFWPRYRGYETAPWFRYESELFIEAPFEISQRRTHILTTHVHRPLEQYIDTFASCGFVVQQIVEPLPDRSARKLYPKPWEFPRFIGVQWRRSPSE
jgi:hypothetical protein